jgi:hypothetical protein
MSFKLELIRQFLVLLHGDDGGVYFRDDGDVIIQVQLDFLLLGPLQKWFLGNLRMF